MMSRVNRAVRADKKEKRGKKKRKKKVAEREGEKKIKKKVFRFSLRSTEIGPPVFIRAKGKVHLRDESFVWV